MGIYTVRHFNVLEISILCSLRQHLLDEKYSKNSINLKYYYIFYFNKCHLFLWWLTGFSAAVTPVFSVIWSFRNKLFQTFDSVCIYIHPSIHTHYRCACSYRRHFWGGIFKTTAISLMWYYLIAMWIWTVFLFSYELTKGWNAAVVLHKLNSVMITAAHSGVLTFDVVVSVVCVCFRKVCLMLQKRGEMVSWWQMPWGEAVSTAG